MADAYTLRPWSDVVRLHPDVESGATRVATYAIDLGALVAKDSNVPAVYRDAGSFFKATYLTPEMKRLMRDVMSCLAGGNADRVVQLRSPFGGGKSHTLASLYHAAKNYESLRFAPELGEIPNPGKIAVAVFDGAKFDALTGKAVAGGKLVKTMWGWLAWQLSQERQDPNIFELMRKHDEERVSPGGDAVAKLLAGRPTLILLDEVLKYILKASAVRVAETNLQQLTADFLDTLVREVAGTNNAVIVYSLQASEREAMGNIGLLEMLDHLTSREEAKREPVGGDQILPVLKKRLLAEAPDRSVVKTVADSYADTVKHSLIAHAATETERRLAEEEAEDLRKEIEESYPFHPALIDIMRQRWASIPDFQRTRGALRFLAVCLYRSKTRKEARAMLGPAEIPIEDGDVRQAFFSEVGQLDPFQAVLESDITGSNARAKRIDSRLRKESPRLANTFPGTRLATATLMYSFGGLPKEGGGQGETLPPGVTEPELLESTLGPDLDSVTAQATLKELREQCLYLHFDGARYTFKTTPNVTKLIEDEAQVVNPDRDIKPLIKHELENRLAGQVSAILWPNGVQIPDEEPSFLIAYLPPEFALMKKADQEANARDLLTQFGNRPRRYRNGLALAIPNRDQLEPLNHSARYVLSIQRVEAKKRQLGITKDQEEQLRERLRTEKAGLESSLRSLYTSIWLLPAEPANALEKVEATGRPLQATGVHERIMELLTQVAHKLHGTLLPRKIIELFHLGEAPSKDAHLKIGVPVKDIVNTFFSSPGFPRLLNADVITRTIVAGVASQQFGYWGQGEPELGSDGKYKVSRQRVAFGTVLQGDEIDIEKGFLIHPNGLPEISSHSPPGPAGLQPTEGHSGITVGPTVLPSPTETSGESQVSYLIEANRDQLFKAWTPLANLAEMAGKVVMHVQAKSDKRLDRNKLRNAVEEPLDELGVLKKSQK